MLDDLYREIILDHYRSPRHKGRVEDPDISARGYNPLCGDDIELTVRLSNGQIEAVAFDGHGCSISQASASMLTEAITGKQLEEALDLAASVRAMFTGEADIDLESLGDLEALQGVNRYPVRIKCATLAWNALQVGAANEGGGGNDSENVYSDEMEV
jgi:nitrogen fixation NifU-like protein